MPAPVARAHLHGSLCGTCPPNCCSAGAFPATHRPGICGTTGARNGTSRRCAAPGAAPPATVDSRADAAADTGQTKPAEQVRFRRAPPGAGDPWIRRFLPRVS